ncbi:MAG: putative ABC exporter domain-containing protein [Fimbriimonadaceae bacterium]
MRPLAFLVSHSLFNGLKRSLSSPKRLVTVLIFVSYYVWIATRSYAASSAFASAPLPAATPLGGFSLDRLLDAAVFTIFMLLSMGLMAQLPSYNRTVTAADVDVLFATPVSPRWVMALRVVRDYLATLLLPLVIGLFTWRPISAGHLLQNMPHPETAGYIVKTAIYAWILLAMVWTVFGYATTLFINRSDLASDRNAKILTRSTTVLVLGTIGYIVYNLSRERSLKMAMRLANSGFLRVPYFIAHLGSMFALGPITGIGNTVFSGIALVALMVLGFSIAMSQVGWMYDQAAVRGFETSESIRLRKSGDVSAILADQARRGKLKTGRQTWLHRLRVRPWGAMIWREAIVQRRSFRGATVFVLITAVAYSLMPIVVYQLSGSRVAGQIAVVGGIFLACQGMGVFMFIMASAATGYVELLKRIDLLKPLPFSPARLMVVEVFAKTFVPVSVSLGCTVLALIACPLLWQFALAHVMYGPSLAVMLSSSVLVVTLLFPDIEDGAQRGFRGLMQLLGIAVATVPGLSALIGITLVARGNPIPGAIVGSLLNLAVTVALTVAAGYLYLGFNPTE